MKKKRSPLLPWLPTLVVLLTLLYLTFQSPQQTTEESGLVQRWLMSLFEAFNDSGEVPAWVYDMHTVRSLAHIPEYLLLGIALWVGFKSVTKRMVFTCIWTLLTGGIIGLLDEGLKELLPTREFDLGDWWLDLVGLTIALVLCWGCWTIRRHHTAQRYE